MYIYIHVLQNIKLLKTYSEHQNSLWYIDSPIHKTCGIVDSLPFHSCSIISYGNFSAIQVWSFKHVDAADIEADISFAGQWLLLEGAVNSIRREWGPSRSTHRYGIYYRCINGNVQYTGKVKENTEVQYILEVYPR